MADSPLPMFDYQRVNMVGIYRATTDMIHMGLEIRDIFVFVVFKPL
jgi:hypothetical protein